MADQETPKSTLGSSAPPVNLPTASSGRCHWCGYQLKGLPIHGKCPECGKDYSEQTAARLKPWPSAFMFCLRLGWPIAGLVFAGFLIEISSSNSLKMQGSALGYLMIVAITINSYFQVRSMLRRSLPEQTRTRGPVAILRSIGTAICIVILLVFVVGPVGIGVACMVLLNY